MDKSRKRLLLGAVALLALLYTGDLVYRHGVEGPRANAARQRIKLEKRIRSTRLALAKGKQAATRLEQLESQSLPWNIEVARSEYQAWLLQRVQQAKLQNPHVDSSEPIAFFAGRGRRKSPDYYQLAFTLRTRGNLKQVVDFLFHFYRADHLHKIRAMNLNPVGRDRYIDLTLSIEALALRTALRETELSHGVSERLASADRSDYQPMVRRNLFSDGRASLAAKRIRLTAVTRNRSGTIEAWFRVNPAGKTQILRAGEPLACPGLEVRVQRILSAEVLVAVDGETIRLRVGQLLVDGHREPTDLAHRID